jgi:transcriptional regulator with XRE-family HTH domain
MKPGEIILTERKRQGLSLEKLSDMAGVSTSAIGTWGKNNIYPKLLPYMQVINALGLKIRVERKMKGK